MLLSFCRTWSLKMNYAFAELSIRRQRWDTEAAGAFVQYVFFFTPRYGGKTDADFSDRKTVNYSVGEARHVPIVQNYERRLIRNFHKSGLHPKMKISQKNLRNLFR